LRQKSMEREVIRDARRWRMFVIEPFEATNANSELRRASLWQHLLIVALVVATGPSARASLIGSAVTADLSLGGGANPYDPAVGWDECQSSPTTTFVNGDGFCALDYSYDGFFTIFTSTGFTFTEQAQMFPLGYPIRLTLTDTAFAGISQIPNTYPPSAFSGLTYGIAGDVITVNIPGQPFWANPTLVASFTLSSGAAVPEPAFLVLLSLVMGIMAIRRFRLIGRRITDTPDSSKGEGAAKQGREVRFK
jgi:hypothetical protein